MMTSKDYEDRAKTAIVFQIVGAIVLGVLFGIVYALHQDPSLTSKADVVKSFNYTNSSKQ